MNTAQIVRHQLGRREANRFMEAGSPGHRASVILDSRGNAARRPATPPLGQATSGLHRDIMGGLVSAVKTHFGGYTPGRVTNATRERMRHDGMVHLALSMIQAPVLKRLVNLEPECKDSPEIAAFTRDWWEKKRFQFLRDAMMMLSFGHAPFEKVWETGDVRFGWDEAPKNPSGKSTWREQRIKGAWRYRKLKPVRPDSVKYVVADEPPYRDVLQGFSQGQELIGDPVKVLYKDRKAAAFTHDVEFEDPQGNAHIDYGYDNWYYRGFGRIFMMRDFERVGTPPVKGWAPTGEDPLVNYVQEDGTNSTRGTTDNLDNFASQLDGLRSNSSLVLPAMYDEKGNRLYDAEFMNTYAKSDQWIALMDHLSLQLLLDLLCPGVYRAKATGTFAEQDALQEVWLWLLNLVVSETIGVVNTQVFPDPVQLTFGLDAPLPVLPVAQIQKNHVKELTEVLGHIANLEAAMWSSAGKPVDVYNSLVYRVGVPELLREIGLTPLPDDKIDALVNAETSGANAQPEKKQAETAALAVGDSRIADLHVKLSDVDRYVAGCLAEYEALLDADAGGIYAIVQRAENDIKDRGRELLEEARKNTDADGSVMSDRMKGPVKRFLKGVTEARDQMQSKISGKAGGAAGPADGSLAYRYLRKAGKLAAKHAKGLLGLYGDKVPDGVENLAVGDFKDIYGDNAWGLWRNIENIGTRDLPKYQEDVRNAVTHGAVVDIDDAIGKGTAVRAGAAARGVGASAEEAGALMGSIRGETWVGDIEKDFGTMDRLVAGWSKKVQASRRPTPDELAKIAGIIRSVPVPARDATLAAIVEGWSVNPVHAKDTIEAHHRATYRRGLFEIGALAGYVAWRMYASPKAQEGDHTEKDRANIGRTARADWWRAQGYDLKQFGSDHYGSRSSWWFVPLGLLALEGMEEEQ